MDEYKGYPNPEFQTPYVVVTMQGFDLDNQETKEIAYYTVSSPDVPTAKVIIYRDLTTNQRAFGGDQDAKFAIGDNEFWAPQLVRLAMPLMPTESKTLGLAQIETYKTLCGPTLWMDMMALKAPFPIAKRRQYMWAKIKQKYGEGYPGV